MLAVIIAGFFQILLGVFKLGGIANYFPSAVIKGMLAAIGIMLIAKQIPVSLGYDEPDFWTSGLLEVFSTKHFLLNIQHINRHTTKIAIIITIISIGVLVLFQQPFAKRIRIIPAPLLIVLIGVAINMAFLHLLSGNSLRQTQLVNIPGNLLSHISFPDFSGFISHVGIWKDGIIIGLLATLETLLCVEAIDKLDKHNRITPINRELVAQGAGNVLCGLLGALPITAVIVRGAANVDAGARTKLSSFTHGAFLLLAVLFVPFLLNKIPYASLAAILIITGYNLTKPKLYKNMWALGMKQFLPFMITIVSILLTDLLIGVTVGLLISVYFIVQNNFKAEYRIQKTVQNGMELYHIKLNTNVSFLNKVKLKQILDEIPEDSDLTIDGSECNFIDYDILEIISEYESKAQDRSITVNLKGIEKVNVQAIH